MVEFARSDLAVECGADTQGEGLHVQRTQVGECEILRVQIKSDEVARETGKPIGRYVTVECGSIATLSAEETERVRCAVAVEIRDLAERMCARRIGSDFFVLVVGLGNAAMTPDAIGPETVRQLCVTRHLEAGERMALQARMLCEIAALAPGVTGQTGLEVQELIRGAVETLHPDLVVAVDALAARSPARLAATVQLSDTGIRPGGGIGQPRRAITAQSVGVPVMAVGVPTVVDSATLVADALSDAGLSVFGEEIEKRLQTGQNLLVSPREIDLVVPAVGMLLAGALEKAFSVT